MCCDRSLEQVRGAEVLPSLFGTPSVAVHLSNPCPFSGSTSFKPLSFQWQYIFQTPVLSVTVHLSNPCPFCDSTSLKPLSFQSFEAVELHISGRNLSVSVVCLYRPPPSRKNKLSNQLFILEFPEFLTQFAGSHNDCLAILTFITMTALIPR